MVFSLITLNSVLLLFCLSLENAMHVLIRNAATARGVAVCLVLLWQLWGCFQGVVRLKPGFV